MELDDTKEKYRHLENSMSSGEKSLKKKVTSLEGNLEQLTLIYHQLVSKLTNAKVENQVYFLFLFLCSHDFLLMRILKYFPKRIIISVLYFTTELRGQTQTEKRTAISPRKKLPRNQRST